ncbi:MAG: hypothetical protein IPQ07_10340 [Myxococcales bacterium]|nr:hypothetical protein [Myxococcales bacterium]
MTKLTTLLVSVLLGASSIAMARPAQLPARDSWRDRQELRLERELASGHRSYRPTWVALSGATKIVRGRDVIQVGAERGRFTQLRFQTTEGTSSIERVLIRFADGRWQVADLDTRLSTDRPMVELVLDGNRRLIDQIIVIGSANRRASYQVFGI